MVGWQACSKLFNDVVVSSATRTEQLLSTRLFISKQKYDDTNNFNRAFIRTRLSVMVSVLVCVFAQLSLMNERTNE